MTSPDAGPVETAEPTAPEPEDKVTNFELFFDLVYVFALTQITEYMARVHSGVGIARGLLLLLLTWFPGRRTRGWATRRGPTSA